MPLRAGRPQDESLVASVNKTSNRIIYLTERTSSAALPKYGRETNTSKTDLLNTSARYEINRYNINSVIEELEKRRAKLLALVRASEARAREVEEEFEQFRSRLKQETKQRMVAEQKLGEFKEGSLRLLGVDLEDAESHLMFGLLVFGNERYEQKMPCKAVKNRAVIDLNKWEKEKKICATEEMHRQQENETKNSLIYGAAIALLVGAACFMLIVAFL